MWLHSFLLYFRQLWRNDWKTSKSIKGFLFFNYNFYYKKSFKKLERSPSRKLIRVFFIYSVWEMPSGLSDVPGYFHLSPVACKTHLFLRCVFCQCWHCFHAYNSVIYSSFLLSCFCPVLHCRGGESNLALENATLLKRNTFLMMEERRDLGQKEINLLTLFKVCLFMEFRNIVCISTYNQTR